MGILRSVYYRLPLGWRTMLRKLYFLPSDIAKKNQRPFHVPADGDNFIGPGDFEKIGQEFIALSQKYGGVKPTDTVLEIGCGMGRMAYPYKSFLSDTGHFVGMDIVPQGIEWCKTRIAPKDGRFEFLLADVKNDLYNPHGNFRGEEFTFPFNDNHFDYIFLTSVFTHMLPEEIHQYIREIARLLKPGSKALMTFFLINENVEKLIATNKSMFNFDVNMGNYRTISKQVKESNVAIEESYMREMVKTTDLSIDSIEYGSWCGRVNYLTFQDVVILTKI